MEEALLMPLRHPEAFAMVAAATGTGLRSHARTAALLFYGPPGTGKTTAARIAAAEAGLPMVYAPLEALFSKWLGQGEQQLAAIFEAAEALGGEGLRRQHLQHRQDLGRERLVHIDQRDI